MSDTIHTDTITVGEFRESAGMADWPVVADGATAFFPTHSYATSSRLVQAICELDGIDDGHADIDVRSGGVTVRLLTKSADGYGMSRRDLELARAISGAAAALGLRADPSVVQTVAPIVVGAVDIPKILPFWKALLGYVERPDSPAEDIVDPRDRGPGVWFEQVEDPASGRPRMHVAVWVPYEQAEARVQAAVAAGGKIIFDEYAPAWWTLADAEGNEADIATPMHRD
ncbi:MAG: Pterin-4-alpha-carbinolamine dehydratase [Chloroflexi bacterium]|nr:Pterin-4-alpha-carbinolamine dehydratase [Chloroflexota bacterium]